MVASLWRNSYLESNYEHGKVFYHHMNGAAFLARQISDTIYATDIKWEDFDKFLVNIDDDFEGYVLYENMEGRQGAKQAIIFEKESDKNLFLLMFGDQVIRVHKWNTIEQMWYP